MWCYQKPGFEALLLAELQRQQQCSQFCDTLLKVDDVSVPAHSCILSAISPHFFSALSSSPAPPAGQGRLLECHALGTCTLLHMVRLLYSGEMAGEGEKEKQEAVSAAAKLGIHGLVEVTEKERKSRNGEGDVQRTETGVQTEELTPEEGGVRPGRWRREVKDRDMFLWKETLSNSKNDSWTQTEELQVNAAPSYQSYETIDMATLQSIGQTDSHLVPPQIPYIPISLVYPPEANETPQPSSAPAASFQETPAAAGSFLPPFSVQTTQWPADADRELEEKQLEQFQDNIPDFINYFLNPDKAEGPRGGRTQRRQGGARKAGGPQEKTGRRGRGGLTQRVVVQEVGVSKLQSSFLQRWGVKACRPGQGGGTVGRKLYLKTREILKKTMACQRRRGGRKTWDVSQSGELVPYVESKPSRSRSAAKESKQVKNPVGSRQRVRTRPAKSAPCSSPPKQPYSVQASAGPSLHPAASYAFPASSAPYVDQPEHFDRLLEEVIMGLDCSSSVNTFSQNKQQNHAAGLPDTGPRFHGSADARGDGRSSCATGEAPVLPQKSEGELTEMLDHFLRSFEQHVESCAAREEEETAAGEASAEVSHSKHSRAKTQITAPQTQAIRRQDETTQGRSQLHKPSAPKHPEGTPERVRDNRTKRRKVKQYPFTLEKPRVRVRVRQRTDTKTKTFPDHGDKQLQQMPVVQLERSGPLPMNVTLQRRSCQCLEVKSLNKAKNSSSSSVNSACVDLSKKNQLLPWIQKTYPIRSRFKEAHIMDSGPILEQQLSDKPASQPTQQPGRPEKNKELHVLSKEESPATVIQLQPVEPDSGPILEQQLSDKPASQPTQQPGRPEKNRELHVLSKEESPATVIQLQPVEPDSGPSLEQQLSDKPASQPTRRRGRPKKNKELHVLSKEESPATVIQLQPVEPSSNDKQPESKKQEEELTVLPQEEAAGGAGRGVKRGAEEECSKDANVAKRACFPSSEATDCVSEAAENEEVIDVETVSLTRLGDTSQRKEQEEKPAWSEIKPGAADQNGEERDRLTDEEMVSGSDEIIDVDGISDGSVVLEREDEKVRCQNRTSLIEVSLGSTGSWEEERDSDIDVVGGSSPAPEPAIISLTESSADEEEEGDEEIDVTEEKTDVLIRSKGENARTIT